MELPFFETEIRRVEQTVERRVVTEKFQTRVKDIGSKIFVKILMGKFLLLLGLPINSMERKKMVSFIFNLERLQM